ncbi:MAG: hypothetical protein WC947_06255 [Elusimicrobiota bacterium]
MQNNCRKNGIYFVDFEFICGEYEQNFGKIFSAKNENFLEKKIHNYLKNYYGKKRLTEITDNVYYFYNGEVGVKCTGWQEVKSFKELVSKLV